jgi:hypothetical protein
MCTSKTGSYFSPPAVARFAWSIAGRGQHETREHVAAAWLPVFDASGLVPDDIVRAEVAQHHEREERIGHREHRSAELRAEVVAVERAEDSLTSISRKSV